MTITLQEFTNIFNDRHDFEYDDQKYLKNKYPTVEFNEIPEAWVCLIDIFLEDISEIVNIKSITQVMGHLVVKSNSKLSKDDFSLLYELEKRTIQLDRDIHEALGEGIVLN